jgi:hypothetical protein
LLKVSERADHAIDALGIEFELEEEILFLQRHPALPDREQPDNPSVEALNEVLEFGISLDESDVADEFGVAAS